MSTLGIPCPPEINSPETLTLKLSALVWLMQLIVMLVGSLSRPGADVGAGVEAGAGVDVGVIDVCVGVGVGVGGGLIMTIGGLGIVIVW